MVILDYWSTLYLAVTAQIARNQTGAKFCGQIAKEKHVGTSCDTIPVSTILSVKNYASPIQDSGSCLYSPIQLGMTMLQCLLSSEITHSLNSLGDA